MVQGYLLDTNIIEYWFNANRPEHDRVISRIESLPPEAPLGVSTITLGEIEYGHRVVSVAPTSIQVQFSEFVEEQLPQSFDIRRSTVVYYGELRARLFEKYAPKRLRKKGLRPEQLIDPVTSAELGIQQNDLWICAQALERNLVLVTNDDKISRVWDLADDLRHENWAELSDG